MSSKKKEGDLYILNFFTFFLILSGSFRIDHYFVIFRYIYIRVLIVQKHLLALRLGSFHVFSKHVNSKAKCKFT
jgi:hypothetical protein